MSDELKQKLREIVESIGTTFDDNRKGYDVETLQELNPNQRGG